MIYWSFGRFFPTCLRLFSECSFAVSLATEYQNNVESLKNQGYLVDIFPIFEDMNREFQNSSSDLQGHINREHLAYIEKQSMGLSQDLKDMLQ